MKIRELNIREIYDSRSEATIEVSLKNEDGFRFSAAIPSGKSTGKKEAKALGFPAASRGLRTLRPYLTGREFANQKELDKRLVEIDGTKDKSKLGGNLLLGVSIAFAKARAFAERKELWEVIREEFFPELRNTLRQPLIFANVINGGVHADNNLSIQEYMLVALPQQNIGSAVHDLISLYKQLGESFSKKEKGRLPALGAEGGYTLNFKDNFQPLEILSKLIMAKRGTKNFGIALDAAASTFFAKGKYKLDKRSLNSADLLKTYLKNFAKYKELLSIEDPFEEDSPMEFAELKRALPKTWIVGDDLTVTNAKLIKKYAESGALSGVIIKPNQVGTLTEAAEAIMAAKDSGLKIICSHRSGETEDQFIVHLARAANAEALKIGAPVKERVFKYNELLRIYSP